MVDSRGDEYLTLLLANEPYLADEAYNCQNTRLLVWLLSVPGSNPAPKVGLKSGNESGTEPISDCSGGTPKGRVSWLRLPSRGFSSTHH